MRHLALAFLLSVALAPGALAADSASQAQSSSAANNCVPYPGGNDSGPFDTKSYGGSEWAFVGAGAGSDWYGMWFPVVCVH